MFAIASACNRPVIPDAEMLKVITDAEMFFSFSMLLTQAAKLWHDLMAGPKILGAEMFSNRWSLTQLGKLAGNDMMDVLGIHCVQMFSSSFTQLVDLAGNGHPILNLYME